MTEINTTYTCVECGYTSKSNFTGCCPSCNTEKPPLIEDFVHDSVSVTDSISWKTVYEYYKIRRRYLYINILILLALAGIGILIPGILGVIIGSSIGTINLLLPPFREKVRIEREVNN